MVVRALFLDPCGGYLRPDTSCACTTSHVRTLHHYLHLPPPSLQTVPVMCLNSLLNLMKPFFHSSFRYYHSIVLHSFSVSEHSSN